ncbi:polymorphic toxin-type HINT domain-containing protein, partial [Haemophilus haemolyticus]
AIKTLIQEGNFTKAMKQSYANRIDKMIVEYEKAGAEGAFKAGLEAGQLLQETVGILAGGLGLAKVGTKFTKAVVTFAKGEKTAVAVVKGSASSTASDIASNALETVKNSRVKALTCSFRGDMEVKTEQGYKPIQSIKVGDKVYAKNELTGQMTYQRVQAHYNNPYDFTVYVEVIDEQGKHQTIVSNKIHPFFTQVNQGELVPSSEGHHYNGEIQNAQWVDAQNLKAGYKLLSENNHWQTVKGVTIKAEKLSAYNLTVETDHTYFIKGANSDLDGVWVHNDCFLDMPKQKVNSASVGDIVRTPTTHPDDFIKLKGGKNFKNKYTGEIWSESHTSHSDKNGEWKVGLKGNAPEVRRKITIGKSDGKIIKFDNK